MSRTAPSSTLARPASAAPSPVRRAFQVLAGLAVLNVLAQFVTAGQLLPSGGPAELHAAGAIVLHVLSGLAAVSAFLLWRRGEIGVRLLALVVVVFGATFVQAALGGYDSLWIHVPGAMVLTVGVVWVLFSALAVGRRS